MNRRHFLGALGAGFALTAAPRWIQKAFAAEPSSKTLVFDAYRRARRGRRPLLVFIIPADPAKRWQRGHAIGAFITHATDAQLAPLALCEVVCATAAHVHLLVPGAPAGEPLAMLIDTTAVPATVDAVTVDLDNPVTVGGRGGNWQEREAAANKIVQANIDRIAVAVGDTIERRAGTAKPALAASARARLSDIEIPGARWAHSGGCGTTYEHPDKNAPVVAIGCGMGFTPEKSRRFLFLLAKPQTR